MFKSKKSDKKSGKSDKKGKADKKNKSGGSRGSVSQSKEAVELQVAIYEPHWGNLHHWALNLRGPSYSYIYQVVGETMAFSAEVCEGVVPEDSGRFTESVNVARINADDVGLLHETITSTPVQNEVSEWCCQDYVIEALERLNNEQIVDDEDYQPARERLLEKFNH